MPTPKPETFDVNPWPAEATDRTEAERQNELAAKKLREKHALFSAIVEHGAFEKFWSELMAQRISVALAVSLDRSATGKQRRLALETWHALTELKNAPLVELKAMREVLQNGTT